MFKLIPYLSTLSILLGLIFFIGIICWAWSPQRKMANNISAKLPFALPDEFDTSSGITKIWEKTAATTEKYITSHDTTANKKMKRIKQHRKEAR